LLPEPLAACAPELVLDPHLVHDFYDGAILRHVTSIRPLVVWRTPVS